MENRLRILRTGRNWSQATLAERLDVSRQTINSIEKGKYDPSLALAMKIAKLFRCQIENIFFFESNIIDENMFDKFNSQAVQAIMLAKEETRRLKHNFIGTEQILLGLIAENTGVAARVLQSLGVTLDDARLEVKKIIGYGTASNIQEEIPFTPRGKWVLDYSLEESRELGHDYIDTEHLLLGSLRVLDGVAIRVLQVLGVDINNLHLKVLEEITPILKEPVSIKSSSTSNNHNYLQHEPVDFTSGAISTRFCRLLHSWVESRKLGYVVTGNTGFVQPNGDILTPHIAFYSKDNLKQVPRIYPESLPNLVVEIKSAFELLASVQDKISRFTEMGIVTLLINPDDRSITVCDRAKPEMLATLNDGDKLTLPGLLPQWELEVSQLWV